MRRLLGLVLAAAVLAATLTATLTATGVAAQDWPTKPIRILTGFQAGGPTDAIARILGDHFARVWGQPVVAEAKPGAGGNVAADLTARAAPDGYTLHVNSAAIAIFYPALYEKLSYDPVKDLVAIGVVTRTPLILETSMAFPPNDFAEFVALMRRDGAKFNYGSPGIGTTVHLAAELLKSRLGIQSTHIAYRGAAPFGEALLKNEVQWGIDPIGNAVIHKGKYKLHAVAAARRVEEFPDVPIFAELGHVDLEIYTAHALFAPAGLPPALVERISAETIRALRDPASVERLRRVGLYAAPMTPAETTRYFAAERDRWVPLIKANNIRAE
ncbi:MAG: hypothetical protein FJX67_07180 [Alphaproteobacteria bacterium]|nr:hypothetical protein [Alphaproteobacteria bacterium]